MADGTVKARDWVALLFVPIVLLLLNWTNASRTEAASRGRELKKERADAITQLLQDEWANAVLAEIMMALPNDMNNSEYRTAKQNFNVNESHLYVDRIKIEILFPDENGKQLAQSTRDLIALGNKHEALKQYANTYKGEYKNKQIELQTLALQALRDTIGKDQIQEAW